jgi:hypothetical protein
MVIIIVIILSVYIIISTFDKDSQAMDAKDKVEEASFDLNQHLINYDIFKSQIIDKKTELYEKYKRAENLEEKKEILNGCKKYLIKTITGKMFDFWYGTNWSFSGTTQTPRSGYIACGYFISTVLYHSGFNVDRYKLAQQPSSLIIKTLCYSKSIKTFNSLDKLNSYLKNNPNSLYILGLDKHVGFIYKFNNEAYFIHSSYTKKRSVTKEKLIQSSAIKQSNIYVIGNLLDNVPILLKWLDGSKITTITQ